MTRQNPLPAGGTATFVAYASHTRLRSTAPFMDFNTYTTIYEVTATLPNTQLRTDIIQTTGMAVFNAQMTPAGSPAIQFIKVNNVVVSGNAVPDFTGSTSDLIVTNNSSPLMGSDDSAIPNTFIEATPEPATLELLGFAPIGLTTLVVRRKSKL